MAWYSLAWMSVPIAFVGEDLGQQALLDPAVDDVDARDAAARRPHALLQLGRQRPRQVGPVLLQERVGLVDRQLPQQLRLRAVLRRRADADAGEGGQVDELDRLQGPGDLDGDVVGVEAVGIALAVAADRRDDRHDVALRAGRGAATASTRSTRPVSW